MRVRTFAVVVSLVVSGLIAAAQTQSAPATASDVYHVHFTKAAPGQADALGKALMQPSPDSPMPDHFVVLRHQEGDDWDYAVIEHLGPKAAVTTAPATNPRGATTEPGTAVKLTFIGREVWSSRWIQRNRLRGRSVCSD